MIKRFYILLLAIVASVGMMNAKVTWNSSNISDLEVYTYQSYSKEGVTLSANADMIDARWFDYGDESQSGIEFHANATGGFTFSNSLGKNFTKIEMTLRGPAGWDHANLGSGWSFWESFGEEEPVFVVTWTGNAKTVDLVKDESHFFGDYVKRIVFYFEGDSEAPDPTYTIALEDGTANADKVTLSKTSAVEGATVTVTPNDEYEITAFSATYAVVEDQVGTIYTIDATLDPATGAYSFTMPAYDVTIEATIAAKPVPEGDIFAGFTATAGSGGFTNEGSANLVDNKYISSNWTKWCTNNDHRSVPTGESGDACWWIDFEASAALNLTGYILTTGNDTGSEHGRNPKNWLLKAKLNADDAWTTIATVTNDVTMKNQSFKDYKFFVDQSGSYKYFRFEVFANQGANVMQLCELRLIGTEASAPATPDWVRDGDSWNDATKTLTVNSNTGNSAYASQTDIKHLIVGDEVTELGWGTFFFDSLMTTVELGNNLETIGISAFNECRSLSTITVPASVTYIGVRAFRNCTSLTTFTCEAVTPPTIGNAIFENDNNLTAIYVPAASVDAYKSAWSDYASLIEAIGGGSTPSWVLAGDIWDEDTKTLTVNSNTGNEAYYQNTEIKHLIISDGVTTIGESAFDECTALLSVVIGNDVTNIEAYAFDECRAMTSLTIGNKVQTIGESAFGSCESLTSVIIPNSVTSIGESAFDTCDKISSLTIGNSVQSIGEDAFTNCSELTDVTIPASVENIGAWFFRNCENLTTITCEATTPPTLGNNAFFDCDNLAHIYVPAASVATYKAATNWATKEAIISAAPAEPIPCTAADLGKVLCTDGSIYATVSEATAAGKTAAAVIAYVDTENGKALALALADESGDMQWATAKTTAPAHTPAVSNGTWTLASKDDWDNMITAAGGYEALRDGFSAVGGTNMNEDKYWSSTPENTNAWCYYFNYGMWVDGYVDNPCYVRACLAFDVPTSGSTPAGALNGAFTINANGDKIVFSRGNLQAKTTDLGANWTWDFAPNQWSLIGNAVANNAINGNKTVSANGTVDLFGWSTAATYYGINKSWNNDDYTGDFVDWGALMGTEWRTLSRAEFRYIVFDRAQAFNKQGKATVNGVSGYIFLPDEWELPSGLSFTPSPGDYTTNQYDGANWEAMEAAGAVFLPAAGDRSGTDIYMYDYGWYWTSTSTVDDKAYYLYFYEKSRDFVEHNRYDAKSVRLVTAAPIPPYEAAIKLINAIGTVELTAECKAKIDTARAAYNALSDGDKGQVTNYSTLTDAETAYANAKQAADQAAADPVIAKINAIPQPVTLKLATRDAIESASAAYEALNAEQKLLVSNYDVLTAAEATMATLNPGGGMPAGALNGAFTINESGDQIAFSKGNLQATTEDNGANWTWSFAAHQWDNIGIEVANNQINGNGTVSENGTVDLFGWSTNATYYGINNSVDVNDYLGEFKEWGTLMGTGWRTLTKDEWSYLRQHSSNGKATVNDKNGYIFLPDNWSGPDFTANPSNWTTNVYSGDDWTAMENAGAVFLPHGYPRVGIEKKNTIASHYWSATCMDMDKKYAYAFFFSQYQAEAYMDGPLNEGCLVRLVAVAATPSPLDSAQAVKDLIETIPSEITLEDACVNAVQAARDAYNALRDEVKGALDDATVQKLNQAIADYTALIQAGADEVKAKINNIPTPVTLKLATRDSIESARAAYEALTADQQALVSNYDVLTAAEATWAGLINVAPAGALSGKYTINDGGDVIYFAHGNLQYTRENLDVDWSTGTFRLAENQYDRIELVKTYPDAYCTDNYGDKTAVGLFGWGTWGEGKTPNLTSSDRTLYTWSTDFSGTLEGTSTWRTLTKDEWVYLLAHNNQSYATVHGVNGLLVAPDGKDIEGKSMTAWVEINDETWTTMQNDGYLFLPACGQRSQLSGANITTGGQGEEVLYYSSTQYNDTYAHNIWYKPGQDPAAADYSNKRQAFGVRLVSAGVNPLDQVQVVKGLIEAIPAEITLDDACVNAIQSARTAYDALDTDAKTILDAADVTKLTDAEAALTALNQAEADEVIAKINAIPTPVELKLATRDSINNARAAYDALNAAQQALVSNYTKLTDAEAALAELNKGGSASVDIVWDGNTGIANVSPTTTSPAYEGMTVTVGKGSSFSTYQSRLYFTFNSQPNGGFIFANENGTNITKVVIESTTALTSTMTEVDRMGSGWVISNENKTATWTGNADSVKIWEGQHFANYWVVDSIVFTVNASSTPLDSAQAVKGLIEAIRENLDPTEACGAEIAAALNAYDALSDAAKGALDAADVQKLNDAATQYPALDAIAAIDMIPAEITYDPMTKSYIEIAKTKYDALSDASKALVPEDKVNKLTNALEAWAILVAKIEHNVSYIGKDGELKNEKVALLHIPDPAPDFNGYEFVRWDVKAGDFLEEGLRIKAVYTPIITTNPVAFDTLVYNGTAQTLVTAGVAKEGHIEYRINDGEWSAELPQATFAAAYIVYYKLVREGHEDYLAGSIAATIAKAPVTYTAPTAVETLVYNASNQTLIAAGQTNDGIFEYTLAPDVAESWSEDLPQAKDAGTYSVYYRVQGDLNHLDSMAVDPIAVTIAKAELTATADNKAIIFGELAPQFTVTYAGWQGDDEASVLTGAIAYATPYVRGNNVDEYTITPSGVDAANYTIAFVDGTLTVNRKSAESSDIMAAQEDDEQLVYTNAVNKPTILVKDTTLTLTEEKDYTLTFVGRGETEYIESATAPTHVGEYTAKIEFIGNYKDMLTVDFTISKAQLTITADDKENIFGEEAPEFTVSYEGFLGTDTKDVLTGSQAYACEYKRGDNVGDYTIIPSGVDAHDYVITFVNGTLTVNRKSAKDADIVAAQLAGEALVYDAEVNRPTIVVTDTTLTLTEDKDYVLTFIGTANDASVYEESAVAPTKAGDYTAIVAFVGNYIDTLTVDFTVSKAPLTITADDKEMIYGDEHPEFTVSYDGFLGTDDNSVLLGTQGYSCVYAPGSYIGTYAITPKDVEADNYAITFVDGTLTVNKTVVKVVGAEAQIAKIEDGNTDAVVLNAGQLEGIKLNDAVAHETTASFSDATVGENKTITLYYTLTGDAALLANYDLIPTSDIFTAEGVIIEDFIPAEEGETEKEDEEAQIEEGIEVYAYGYCLDDHVYMRYHLNRGNPDQYKIEFADNRFTDVNYGDYTISGPDGTIEINIPVDMPTGDYQMTVTFRDSRFDWLESNPFTVTFHVNLPETYVKPLFENTIVLVDTCNCFTDIQWYHRADASEAWQPIAGATGHYYRPEGGAKLTGEFFVKASMNGEPTYTCGQTDMETLYGADKQQPKATVKAFPNPVVNSTTVTIENSENWNHSLRVVNTVGIEMFRTTFEGNETELRMDGFVQGNYMISVDGIVVKVMKK